MHRLFVAFTGMTAAGLAMVSPAQADPPDISGTWSTPFAVHSSGLGLTAGVTEWTAQSVGDPTKATPSTLQGLGALADASVRAHNGVPIFGAPHPAPPPFTPAGRAAFAAIDTKVVLDRDVACYPLNVMARIGLGAVQIVEGKTAVSMLSDGGLGRTIFLDGRAETDALPQWSGHSVGRWDGDVLKVRTTAIRGGVFGMPMFIFPISEEAVVEENYRLTQDGKHLVLLETLIDPTYYKEPLVRMAYLERVKDETTDYTCEEGKSDMIEMVSKPALDPKPGAAPAR